MQPFLGLGNSLQTAQGGSGAVGGWVELARTTLGSAGDSIDVTSLPDKRYYMFLTSDQNTGAVDYQITFNADTGTNYARRSEVNGGTDTTATTESNIYMLGSNSGGNGKPANFVGHISNLSGKEKLLQAHAVYQDTAGATTAPGRMADVGKWSNTSSAIDQITISNASAGSYSTGAELVVLGWDPADTHTTNFWEELASVNGDGTGGFDTGTFTSKKYLWVQAYLDPSTSARNNFRVGNSTVDTGTNYTNRGSTDGGADSTETSVTIVRGNATSYSTPSFFNMFIINNSANEKLVIGHTVIQNTAGAGTAPNRIEFVSKWANTSNQIDIIEAFPSSGNYSTTSQIKVWGSD